MILFGIRHPVSIMVLSKKGSKKYHNNFHVIGIADLFVDYNHVKISEKVVSIEL